MSYFALMCLPFTADIDQVSAIDPRNPFTDGAKLHVDNSQIEGEQSIATVKKVNGSRILVKVKNWPDWCVIHDMFIVVCLTRICALPYF